MLHAYGVVCKNEDTAHDHVTLLHSTCSFDRASLYDCCNNSRAVQQVCVLSVVWSVFGFTGEVYMIQSCDKKSLFNLSICFCCLHVCFSRLLLYLVQYNSVIMQYAL